MPAPARQAKPIERGSPIIVRGEIYRVVDLPAGGTPLLVALPPKRKPTHKLHVLGVEWWPRLRTYRPIGAFRIEEIA